MFNCIVALRLDTSASQHLFSIHRNSVIVRKSTCRTGRMSNFLCIVIFFFSVYSLNNNEIFINVNHLIIYEILTHMRGREKNKATTYACNHTHANNRKFQTAFIMENIENENKKQKRKQKRKSKRKRKRKRKKQ